MLKTWRRSDVRKERELREKRDQWLQNQIRSAGKTLDLSDNNIDDEDAKAIAKALQRNTILTELYLWGNNIGDEGATAIAEALQRNTVLTMLYLNSNHIGAEGATAIAKALQQNTVLQVLNLMNNKIGNEGATAIAEVLQQNTPLTWLFLNANSIGNVGATAIAKALQHNTVLTMLYLHHNNTGASNWSSIQSTLEMSAEERQQQKEEILRKEMASATDTVGAAAIKNSSTGKVPPATYATSPLLLETQSSTENPPEQLDDSPDDKKGDEAVISGTNTQPIENTAVAVSPLSQQQLFEVANLLGFVSNRESADLLNRLLPLADHVDPLKAVAHDQHCVAAAEQELRAIRNDQRNREFYLSLYESLDCTIAACQTLASGMIAQAESKTGIRSWLLTMSKDTAWKSLKEHTDIRQVVDRSIQWAAKQIPLPFMDTAGKALCVLFHTLFSLKQERQKYLAIANVAAFAVIAKHNKGGLHQTISNVCRYMVRDGRFVGSKPEFKQWQSWAAKMLADTSATHSKAQGCLVAELVMQCIMDPPPKSAMATILHEGADSSKVDAALTSLVLNMSTGEVVKLKSFTTTQLQDSVAAGVVNDHSCALSDKPDAQQGPSDVDLVALQKFVQQQAQEISNLKSKLSKLSNQRDYQTSVDVGNGQVQVYATSSYEEQNKAHFAGLEKEVRTNTNQLTLVTAASDIHGEQITKLVETTTDLYETMQKLKDDDVRIAKKKKGSLGKSIGRPDP